MAGAKKETTMPVRISEKQAKDESKPARDKRGRLLPGHTANPNGRPKGSEDFKTKWLRFIDKVSAANNVTPEEVDEDLLKVAYEQMRKADFRYWKDIQDRVHGAANSNNAIAAVQVNIGEKSGPTPQIDAIVAEFEKRIYEATAEHVETHHEEAEGKGE